MNTQELIEKLENDLTMLSEIKGIKYEYDRGYEQVIKEHLAMISDLDWPDKPVVPQFVADWIETHKRCMPFLSHLFTDNLDEELKEWLDFSDNQNLMAKAWLYGYEVEKEKLYTVEIPNPRSKHCKTYLGRNKYGEVELFNWYWYSSIDFADNWKQEENAQLTESEIRKDFDWAFQFAKEV